MTDPAPPRESTTRRDTELRRTLAITVGLLFVLAAVLGQVAVPFVLLSPGPTSDTLGSVKGTPLISVEGRRTYPVTGKLNLTTVLTTRADSRVDLVSALAAWFDRDQAVVPRSQVYPPDQSASESRERNAAEMTRSQVHAVDAAMNHLGIEPLGAEVVIASVAADAAAKGSLEAGDVVVSVDGKSVTDAEQLRDLISPLAPGTTVSIDVRRGGEPRTAQVTTAASPDDPSRSLLGVVPTDSERYPFQVRISIDDVGGPSAGLMFALGIIEKLTPEDLTGGAFIAGTGTIDAKGTVGPIGGIQQKLRAARDAGATIFLVPAEDCADAVPARPEGLRLVRVEDLDEALAALGALRSDDDAAVPTCSR